MYQSDNQFSKYIWKDEWNLPYESLYGRIEKFRKVNVLKPANLDNIIQIGADSTYHLFSKKTLIFRKQNYKIVSDNPLFEIDNRFFQDFNILDGIFDIRFRYCPVCMKNGYHSFFHQLTYMDTCFIHKKVPLCYRCSCSETYVLRRRKSTLELFQCEFCQAKPKYIPQISDGIINSWWLTSNIQNRCRYKSTYNSINLLDFSLSCMDKSIKSGKSTAYSPLQQKVLREITLTGRTWQKPQYIGLKDTNSSSSKIIISNLIIQYMVKHYDEEQILAHFSHISNRFYSYKIGNYDVKLLTILFLLKELQCKQNIDELNLGYGLYNHHDGKLKAYLNDERSSVIIHFLEYSFFIADIKIEEYTEMYNVLLKKLILARYEHIYNCFLYNQPETYPCKSSSVISYDHWKYPIYIMINNDNRIMIY